jgi:hypothetical protein
MKRLLFILLFILLPSSLWAACSGSSPNLTAASANRDDVAACVAAATYGDTINIPACAQDACVWHDSGTNGGTITINKNIRIVGAGASGGTQTYIGHDMTATSSVYNYLFYIDPDATAIANTDSLSDTGIFEITGIHFYHAYPKVDYVFPIAMVNGYGTPTPVKRFRVHANAFDNFWYGMWIYGYVHGLADNNIVTETQLAAVEHVGTFGIGEVHPWNNDLRHIGTSEAFYIEDNTGVASVDDYNAWFTSNNQGPSVVARYNTMTMSSTGRTFGWETHIPASQFTEVYGNLFTGAAWAQVPQIRSGVGIVFFNKGENEGFRLRHERSYYTIGGSYGWQPPQAIACAYATAYDPYTGTSPIDCNDSIDVGPDCYCSKVNHSYFWNNRNAAGTVKNAGKDNDAEDDSWNTDANQTNSDVGTMTKLELKADREFFNMAASFDGTSGMGCGTLAQMNAITPTLTNAGFWVTTQNNCGSLSADNVGVNPTTPILGTLYRWDGDSWEIYYTPYAYPHPLRGEEGVTEYTLTVTKSGTGTVTGTYTNCGSTCTPDITSGTTEILTATSGSGYWFGGFTGCDNATGLTCTVVMDGDHTVTATFRVNSITIGSGGTVSIGTGGTMTLAP